MDRSPAVAAESSQVRQAPRSDRLLGLPSCNRASHSLVCSPCWPCSSAPVPRATPAMARRRAATRGPRCRSFQWRHVVRAHRCERGKRRDGLPDPTGLRGQVVGREQRDAPPAAAFRDHPHEPRFRLRHRPSDRRAEQTRRRRHVDRLRSLQRVRRRCRHDARCRGVGADPGQSVHHVTDVATPSIRARLRAHRVRGFVLAASDRRRRTPVCVSATDHGNHPAQGHPCSGSPPLHAPGFASAASRSSR
jgi:hypothetical protein